MGLFITDEEIAAKLVADLLERQYQIILFNDPTITVEHVLKCLMKYADHTLEQAAQCISIIENKGSYAIKVGPVKKLTPIYKALTNNKLTCIIK
jgi:ATP-dependent Clp protease adapter protein ClpS